MSSDDDLSLIYSERLRSVFSHAPLVILINLLNAVLMVLVIGNHGTDIWWQTWLGAVAALSAARLIVARLFRRHPTQKRSWRWGAIAVGSACINGTAWGIVASTAIATEPERLFIALVVAGMSAGAVTTSSPYWPAAIGFIIPAASPLAVRFLAEGGVWRVSALMICIFVSALSLVSVRNHIAFGQQIRLRLALAREQLKLHDANKKLQDEIVERKHAEEALQQAQKMEAIGHLTGGIAHDFTNLLQVVVGNLGLIEQAAGADERIIRYAEAARLAASRGAALTSSLLTFARRQAMEPIPVSMNVLLRQFEPVLIRSCPGNVRFSLALAPDVPDCLTDPAHFQSAVLNLVINARDAMPDGGAVTVSTGSGDLDAVALRANTDAKPGRFVFVAVSDTGVGIEPDVLARVFEPFFTTKAAGKGTGLGLSQVFGFARQSGGHIELVSEAGRGTLARLWLPVADPLA